jgi:hypothetical protein
MTTTTATNKYVQGRGMFIRLTSSRLYGNFYAKEQFPPEYY